MSNYPNADKLLEHQQGYNAAYQVLEWLLQSKQLHLCVVHEHTDGCYIPHQHNEYCYPSPYRCTQQRDQVCGFRDNEYASYLGSIEKLLHEFYGIDSRELERERRQMLNDLRAAREAAGAE